eukprot:2461294-Alexandrium_andersonii.AAC.1
MASGTTRALLRRARSSEPFDAPPSTVGKGSSGRALRTALRRPSCCTKSWAAFHGTGAHCRALLNRQRSGR